MFIIPIITLPRNRFDKTNNGITDINPFFEKKKKTIPERNFYARNKPVKHRMINHTRGGDLIDQVGVPQNSSHLDPNHGS